jgi:hypothetical protein
MPLSSGSLKGKKCRLLTRLKSGDLGICNAICLGQLVISPDTVGEQTLLKKRTYAFGEEDGAY